MDRDIPLNTTSQSPLLGASPLDKVLPLSPDDYERVCDEIFQWDAAATPWSHVWDTALQQDESSRTMYYAQQESLLPMPWIANGAVTQLDTFHQQPIPSPGPNVVEVTNALGLAKRPLPDGSEHEQQPPLKSMRTADNWAALQETEEEEEIVYGEPHLDLGVDEGKHRCSCGKKYTRQFRLRLHIEVHSRNARYPCTVCGMTFRRADSLLRHEDNNHKDKKIACPGCRKSFRSDYLPKHLASTQNAKCAVIAEATYQANNGIAIDARLPAENHWIPSIVERRRQIHSDSKGMQNTLTASDQRLNPEVSAKVSQDIKSAQTRPIQRLTREPCDLCGMPLGPGEQELIDHIGKHSLDFSAKPHKCDQCQIGFAYLSDLQMHRKAAKEGHCGFGFFHGRNKTEVGSECCTGHHPPPFYALEIDHHKRMQETLWSWENCQLRAHRATIARLLAERLQYTQASRRSIANDELTCIASLSRLSIGSFDSLHSEPAWMQYQDKNDLEDLDAKVPDLDLFFNETAGQTGHDNVLTSTPARRESTILGGSILDIIAERGSGHSKLVVPQETSTPNLPVGTSSVGSKNSYNHQVKAMKAPGGMKTTASGVRYRAKAATRYFLPSHWDIGQPVRVQYVVTTVA